MTSKFDQRLKPNQQRRRHLLSAACSLPSMAFMHTLSAMEGKRNGKNDRKQGVSLALQADLKSRINVLKLAPGFRYHSILWTGQVMSDGSLTPDRPDGMACFPKSNQEICLVRNHERAAIEPPNTQGLIGTTQTPRYDSLSLPKRLVGMGGGTTNVVLNEKLQIVKSYASLSGTLVNCAGGPTPWGSWLSCEEIELRGSRIGGKDHGYVFEVPASDKVQASAKPIKGMGFMRHEAAAVGADGSVFLTEDNKHGSGFYRFIPQDKSAKLGSLERGGQLQMLRIKPSQPLAQSRLQRGQSFSVDWVDIDNPDADPELLLAPAAKQPRILGAGRSGPFLQGQAQGAAAFGRLEGAWQLSGDIYFVDTTGGAAKSGAVWRLSASKKGQAHALLDTLEVVYVSPNEGEADHIDNLTVNAQGGIVLCEDGAGGRNGLGQLVRGTRLLALTPRGEIRVIAENALQLDKPSPELGLVAGDYRDQEFAGACFDPKGDVLFVNIQTPGILLAIEGPWKKVFA